MDEWCLHFIKQLNFHIFWKTLETNKMNFILPILCIVSFMTIGCSAFSFNFKQKCPSVNAIANFKVEQVRIYITNFIC
jgi:hypothetical protein